jgi:hypothetical protein
MRRCLTALLLVLTSATLWGQQIAFTLRGRLIQCPVTVSSFTQSKEFGFDSIVLRNESAQPIEAVRFQVVFRTETGDEPVDGARVVIRLEPKDSKRLSIGLGQVTALTQKAKSAHQAAGLAILSVESVELPDGSVLWRDSGPVEGDLPLLPNLRK